MSRNMKSNHRPSGTGRESTSHSSMYSSSSAASLKSRPSSKHAAMHSSSSESDSDNDNEDPFAAHRKAENKPRHATSASSSSAPAHRHSSASSTSSTFPSRVTSAISSSSSSSSLSTTRPPPGALQIPESSGQMNSNLKSPSRSPSASSISSPRATSLASSFSSTSTSAAAPLATSGASSTHTQMKDLLSFLDEHEQVIAKDQQLLVKIASKTQSLTSPRASSSALSSPRSVSSHQRPGPFEAAFAASKAPSSVASTQVQSYAAPAKHHSAARGSSAASSSAASSVVSHPPSTAASTIVAPPSSTSTGSLSEIKSKLISMKTLLNEKESQLHSLERTIADLKSFHQTQLQTQASQFQLQLSTQKAEYESALLRHQSFIETLIQNKEELSTKVQKLTEEIQEIQKGFERKLSEALISQEMAFNKKQEIFLQQEKIKRDTFIAQKTKLIKSNTIKGLEPEIEKILEKSKKDLQAQEQILTQNFTDQLNQVQREHEGMLQSLRQTLLQERDHQVDAERAKNMEVQERIREEFEAQAEKLRSKYKEEIEHVHHNYAVGTANSNAIAAITAAENNKKDTSALSSFESRIENLKAAHERDLALANQRFDSQLAVQQLELNKEKLALQSSMQEMLASEFRTREAELRSKLQAEQDGEMEMVMSRLSREHQKELEKLQTAVENAQHDNMKLQKALDNTERNSKDSSFELRAQVASLTQQLALESARASSFARRAEEKEQSIVALQKQLDKFELQRSSLHDEVESASRGRIQALESERDTYQQQYRDERDRGLEEKRKLEKQHQDRLALQERKHASEVESVQLRVKHMLEKKELVITQLRTELDAKERKIKEMEQFMNEM